jgi:starch-binding outer membrane protein, SusD/RagB family
MKYSIILIMMLACIGCKKYLDQKPDRSMVVPQSVKDLQAVLDNTNIMNVNYPFSVEIGVDDYYLTTADWLSRSITEKNGYIWESDMFNENPRNDWSLPYTIVYNSNVVLDQLKKLGERAGTQQEINNVKGQALFFRSFAFYNLLQVFAKPYTADSATFHWGIALRLKSDLNDPTTRATLKESFDQVTADLSEAAGLLSPLQTLKTRPNKQSAFALLSRTYLIMNEYAKALLYADSALQLNNSLIDFNTLNATATRPIPLFNIECIFHSVYLTTNSINILAKIDTTLLASYASDDLRSKVFFRRNSDASYSFKGSYDGSGRSFNGLAIDELYLIKAECLARTGNTNVAMNTLNQLLLKRWKTGTFVPYTAADATEALTKILLERRKELLMRGLRWTDLRRLNKETRFAKTLIRNVNNQTFFLYPNDPRYTFPIPLLIIQMTGMPQNER